MDSTTLMIAGAILAIFGVILASGKSKFKTGNKSLAYFFAFIFVIAGIWMLVSGAIAAGFLHGATIGGGSGDIPVVSALGTLGVTLHDGQDNVTTTEDYYNDAKTQITFYLADASQADGQGIFYLANITRTKVSDAAAIVVTCTLPDKALSGVTDLNIAKKSAGKVQAYLDGKQAYVPGDGNSVKEIVSFAAGVSEVQVNSTFLQDETYTDGMTDLTDYATMNCKAVGDNGETVSWNALYYTQG